MTGIDAATRDEPASESLKRIDRCLWCNGAERMVAADAVEDWFFGCVPGRFRYDRCAACGSLWLAERPRADQLHRAYASYYTHRAEALGEPPRGLRARVRHACSRAAHAARPGLGETVAAALARLLSRNPVELQATCRFAPRAPGRILDYGCGDGAYLARMRALGFAVTGVESDPVMLARLEEEGLPAIDAAHVDAQDWNACFDHVTLAHVIEHVADPGALLRRIANWLKPGGTVFIEAPQADAEGLARFGRFWRGLEAPRHFSIPSRAALAHALAAAGLTVERDVLRPSVRGWMWEESADAARSAGSASPPPTPAAPATPATGEFVTLLARKQDRP